MRNNAKDATNAKDTKRLILMMGGPASGKSRMRKEHYGHLPVVDCDLIKESHPDYDPKNPALLHEWSSREATAKVYGALGDGISVVFDGTGNNAEKYAGFANAAHELGYEVTVCYVTTSLREAIRRNRARARTVPEDMLRQRHSTVALSFEIVSRYCDHSRIIAN